MHARMRANRGQKTPDTNQSTWQLVGRMLPTLPRGRGCGSCSGAALMAKSPLQTVKDRFKDKAGLITAVQSLMTDALWTDKVNTDKGLDSVSNKKLLHLHEVLSEVKSKFGSRAKLIDAIATNATRQKDAEFRKGLERFPTPRLFEIARAGEKRTKKA